MEEFYDGEGKVIVECGMRLVDRWRNEIMFALTSTNFHYLHHSSPFSSSFSVQLTPPSSHHTSHLFPMRKCALRLSVLPHPLGMSVSFSIPPTSSVSHHFLCGLRSTPSLLHYYFLCMSLFILIPLSLLPLCPTVTFTAFHCSLCFHFSRFSLPNHLYLPAPILPCVVLPYPF